MKKHRPPRGHWLDNLVVWLGQQVESQPDFYLPEPLSPQEFWSSLIARDSQLEEPSLQFQKQLTTHNKLFISYPSRIIREETTLNTVKGVFLENKQHEQASALLLIHGNGMPNHLWEEKYASYCLPWGYQVAYLDLPYHMQRRPKNGKRKSLSADLEMTRLNIAQGVIDNLDLINWLKERRGIEKVGVLGSSIGGLIALLLATQVPLDFIVVLNPVVDLTYLLWEGIPLGGIREKFEKNGISSAKELELYLQPLLPKFYQPLVSPNRILLIKGEKDEIVGSRNVDRLIREWGLTNVLCLPQGHLSLAFHFYFSGFPQELKDFLLSYI